MVTVCSTPSIVTFTALKFPLIRQIQCKSMIRGMNICSGCQLEGTPSMGVTELLAAGLCDCSEILNHWSQKIINVGLYL